jgi:hypothetical protein
MGERMENQYYQKKYAEAQSQTETSIPLVYEREFSLKDKEKIVKDFYSNMKAFYEIVYQSGKEY